MAAVWILKFRGREWDYEGLGFSFEREMKKKIISIRFFATTLLYLYI